MNHETDWSLTPGLGRYVEEWDDPDWFLGVRSSLPVKRSVSSGLRYAVLARDHYTCRSCHRTGIPLHVDHITPLARGGGNDAGNLQTLCAACNLGKGTS
ncbi:MAG: HNH endonuclease [Gammaproteobacteria bacterium]